MPDVNITNQNGDIEVLGRKAFFNANQTQININMNINVAMKFDRETKIATVVNPDELGSLDATEITTALEAALNTIDQTV